MSDKKPPTQLKVGDEIEVYGQRFILVGSGCEANRPAWVDFKQPIELMKEVRRGD